jgi:hypothetical protein
LFHLLAVTHIIEEAQDRSASDILINEPGEIPLAVRHISVSVDEPGGYESTHLLAVCHGFVGFLKTLTVLGVNQRHGTSEGLAISEFRRAEKLFRLVVPGKALPFGIELDHGERGVVHVVKQALAGLGESAFTDPVPGQIPHDGDDGLRLVEDEVGEELAGVADRQRAELVDRKSVV